MSGNTGKEGLLKMRFKLWLRIAKRRGNGKRGWVVLGRNLPRTKSEEIYHEPYEPARTTTRYVQKVRDFRVVRSKKKGCILRFIFPSIQQYFQ